MIERGLIKRPDGYIHYRCDGAGKPLILLHPVMWSSTAFLEIMPYLAKKCRVYALDNPGYGDSDRPPRLYSVLDYAQTVVDFMAELGLSEVSVLGDAFGAIVAAELAAIYPEKVRKLVLLNSPFYRDENERKKRQSVPRNSFTFNEDGFPMPRTLKEALERDPDHVPMKPTELWIERTNTDMAKAGKGIYRAIDVQSAGGIATALTRIQCPTLIIIADRRYVGFKDEFQRRVKDGRVVIMPGAQWMPEVDQPEELSRLVMEFLLER